MALSSRLLAFAAKLDLGRKPMDGCDVACGPKIAQPRVWYPSLWLESNDQPIDLPETGKAVIEYKITRKTTAETNGKKRYEVSMDVQSIAPHDDAKKEKKLPGSAKPLPVKGFCALSRGMITFAGDSRPRNPEGEFAPQAAGGPDPNAMDLAYGPAAIQTSSQGAGAVAGLGGTAAASLLAKKRAVQALRAPSADVS